MAAIEVHVSDTGKIAFGPPLVDALGTPYRPFRYFSKDGLALAGRDYGTPNPAGPPLLCLPGLTRNSRDFEPVAAGFAASRRVVTFDYRGRGASMRDPEPARYTPLIEAEDVVAGLDALGIDRVTVLGTSRGGLIATILPTLRPNLVAAAILNDVGPVIERAGLLRIKSYVGQGKPVSTWSEAVDRLRAMGGESFPKLKNDDFDRLARRIYRNEAGRPVSDYDPALAQGLALVTPYTPLPTFWPQFELLAAIPIMVIRGELSDLLARSTVEEMGRRHTSAPFRSLEVPDQGHAPLLEDATTLDAVALFLAETDGLPFVPAAATKMPGGFSAGHMLKVLGRIFRRPA